MKSSAQFPVLILESSSFTSGLRLRIHIYPTSLNMNGNAFPFEVIEMHRSPKKAALYGYILDSITEKTFRFEVVNCNLVYNSKRGRNVFSFDGRWQKRHYRNGPILSDRCVAYIAAICLFLLSWLRFHEGGHTESLTHTRSKACSSREQQRRRRNVDCGGASRQRRCNKQYH